jgi:sulfide dehydrogenase cytochrome subunit
MRYTKGNVLIVVFLCAGFVICGVANGDTGTKDVASLAAQCEGCHGKGGASQVPQIPIIGGVSSLYLRDAMAAFREKSRPCMGGTMCLMAKSLSEADTQRLADYFASKPFIRARQSFDDDLAKRGRDIFNRYCNKCHENGGSMAQDDAGIMAGQWKPYLEEQFKDYASGKRLMPEKMKPKMAKLQGEDIKALLQFFASFQQTDLGINQAAASAYSHQ